VKQKLEDNNLKYKAREDSNRRQVNLEEGDLVMVHLKKGIFPRGTYNKLKWKKIGPCKILSKFSSNAYEVEFPKDVGISPIFNVSYLYPYHEDKSSHPTTQDKDGQEVPWEGQFPKATPTIPKRILDKRMSKKTRGKEYYEYLIKWKNHPIEDSTWVTSTMPQKSGVIVEDLMDRSP
jgi:hypothetical protein